LQPVGQVLWQQFLRWGYAKLDGRSFGTLGEWPDQRACQLGYWGISLGTGILCSLASLTFIGRLRLSRLERGVWLVFLMFYGIAGLLAFRVVNDWPLRLTCGKCGKKRSAEDANCEHCGEGWPLAVKDGTEIFEKESA
jgi:hypothetical protein